jgi:hypothetical protein
VMEIVPSSDNTNMSSIGIVEFGMNPAWRGTNAAAFSIAVKESLLSMPLQ